MKPSPTKSNADLGKLPWPEPQSTTTPKTRTTGLMDNQIYLKQEASNVMDVEETTNTEINVLLCDHSADIVEK